MIRAWAAAALALLLGGCALLRPEAPPAAPAAPQPAAVAPQVEIDAPRELRTLLERHLDVVRLGALSSGEPIGDVEWRRLVDATPAQARELLQTEGYFDATVRIAREIGPGGDDSGRIRLHVDPGPRVVVGRVGIEVAGALRDQAQAGDARAVALLRSLRDDWLLKEGRPFRNPAWIDAKAALLTRLRAAGYLAASWADTRADIDADARRAELELRADSGPLFRAGELHIEGLKIHDAATVRHLAGFAPGTPLTEALLLDYQERLQKAGLFDQVAVLADPDPAQAAAARIDVRVRETPLQQATVGIGISANTGPRASVEHLHRRFLGRALIARNKLEWGGRRQAWEGEVSTHALAGLVRNLAGGAIERLETDADTVLSQRMRVGRARETDRDARLSFVELERALRSTATSRSESRALTLNHHATWRRLDSIILPTRGASLALQGGVGRSTGDSDPGGTFARAWGRLTCYRPFGSWYGSARVELGQVFAGDHVAVPETQRFRAGGDESVRGHAYRSLGPVVGGAVASGRVVFTGSVEVARPVAASWPSIWGAAFVDAGDAADRFGDLKPALGVGVGVRWRSPVGPLRLDLAWGERVKRARLHFSVGITF